MDNCGRKATIHLITPKRNVWQSSISYFSLFRTLGEIYPSAYLTKIIKSIKTRFFVFFQYQGYSAFGFFDSLPDRSKFGFEEKARPFGTDPSPANLIKYAEKAKNLKEVLIALIEAHNNAYLEQFLIPDYELLLNKLLEGEE